jgi:hypothetical protein
MEQMMVSDGKYAPLSMSLQVAARLNVIQNNQRAWAKTHFRDMPSRDLPPIISDHRMVICRTPDERQRVREIDELFLSEEKTFRALHSVRSDVKRAQIAIPELEKKLAEMKAWLDSNELRLPEVESENKAVIDRLALHGMTVKNTVVGG